MGLNDYALSLGMRDAINQFVLTSIDKLRPKPRYATVDSIDRINGRCGVIYTGEENPMYVSAPGLWPMYLGQTVRIEGIGTDKYIAGVVGPAATNTLRPLGVVDLNDILQSGWYIQRGNASAVSGSNYPIPLAGWLEVINDYRDANNFIFQRYTTYSGSSTPSNNSTIWQRGLYGTTWGPWQMVLSGPIEGIYGLTSQADIVFKSASNRAIQWTSPTGTQLARLLGTNDGRLIMNADEALATASRFTLNADGSAMLGSRHLPTVFQGAGIIIAAGSAVVGTNASGIATVPYGYTFPNSMIAMLPTPGDTAGALASTVSTGAMGGASSRASNTVRCTTATGAVIVSTTVRINWIAIGK